MDSSTMRITIDRASGGFRVHVWMRESDELVFWSDIYSAKQNAQRAAFRLKSYAGSAVIEDLTVSELTGHRS